MISRLIKYLVLLLLVISINAGCFPAPWKAERIESYAPYGMVAPPEQTSELQQYFLGNAFVQAGIIAKNATTSSGSSPYRLVVSLVEHTSIAKSLNVHNIVIKVNNEVLTEYTFHALHHRDEGQKILLSTPFKLAKDNTLPVNRRLGFVSSLIEVDFSQLVEIEVTIDIGADFPEGTERSAMIYKFLPIVEKGVFSWIEV